MVRLVLLFLSGCFVFPSWAATPCYEYQLLTQPEKGWFSSSQAACGAFSYPALGDGWSEKSRGVSGSADDGSLYCTVNFHFDNGAWTNDSVMGSQILRRSKPACDDVCKAGAKKTINFTVGYHATPATNTALNPFIIVDSFYRQLQKDKGATMCYEGCKVGVPHNESDVGWISQVAGPNGLYRSSVDIETRSTSQACTVDPNSDASKSASTGTAPPTCPGSLGTVNGATVCLPSVADAGIDGGGEATRGNPPAGPKDETKSPSERAKGPGGTGNGSSPSGSNGGGPTGGPASGPNNGSSRTGCNDGSKAPAPPCSGKGTNDQDGTVTKPATGKEQAACGAPGQPKCGIDETGTPEKVGDDKYNSKLDQYKTDSKNAGDQIKGEGDGVFSSYTTFFAAPALQACEPVELPTAAGVSLGSISKQCDVVEGVRYVMAYIWALVGMWVCLGWVKRATN